MFLLAPMSSNPTKGDILRHCLAYALIKVRVARHKLRLSEAERYEVADHTLRRLRETGQWKELDDEAGEARLSPSRKPGPYT